jgi:hypothetical protein
MTQITQIKHQIVLILLENISIVNFRTYSTLFFKGFRYSSVLSVPSVLKKIRGANKTL